MTHPPHQANKPAVVVVAHTSRAAWANELAAQTNAAAVSMDDGALGCYRNHLAAWRYHQNNTRGRWSVVIEDDALPVADFVHQLDMALTAAPPTISVVGLYLGRARPPQYQRAVAAAVIDAAQRDHAWILPDPPKLLSAVGTAIRTECVPGMVEAITRTAARLDIDEAITQWAAQRHLIGYTAPSLLDHRDTPTIAAHRDGQPRPPGRTAYLTGTRKNWKTPATVMKLP